MGRNYWRGRRHRFPLYRPAPLHPPIEKFDELAGVEWLVDHHLEIPESVEIELDVATRTVQLPEGEFDVDSFLRAAMGIVECLKAQGRLEG